MRRGKASGSITVFMSLCLSVCLLFTGALLESARALLLRDQLQQGTEAALDSLFARCPMLPMLEPELVRCRYGNDANLIGALKLFFEQNPA